VREARGAISRQLVFSDLSVFKLGCLVLVSEREMDLHLGAAANLSNGRSSMGTRVKPLTPNFDEMRWQTAAHLYAWFR